MKQAEASDLMNYWSSFDCSRTTSYRLIGYVLNLRFSLWWLWSVLSFGMWELVDR